MHGRTVSGGGQSILNGVINIWKEKGYSSFHVVYVLRKITGEQKVGHTGTLDPEVCGVLPVCLGKATKLVGQLTDTDKRYQCTMILGKRTDTQDLTGTVLEEISSEEVRSRLQKLAEERTGSGASKGEKFYLRSLERNIDTLKPPDPEHDRGGQDQNFDMSWVIRQTLEEFQGEILQTPPMYSALKVDGVKLVDAARKGREVKRSPRPVRIYSIDDIRISEDLQTIQFNVYCSKGTYIRTLCEDAGEKLGIPACMSSLERTCASGLDRTTAITLDQAAEYARAGVLEDYLIPTDQFLRIYPAVTVRKDFVRKLIYGNQFRQEDVLQIRSGEDGSEDCSADRQIFRVYDPAGIFYALYQYDAQKTCYRCVKMFHTVSESSEHGS